MRPEYPMGDPIIKSWYIPHKKIISGKYHCIFESLERKINKHTITVISKIS
jgi:hypothetical protein